jgi:hypothetical protein
VSTVIDAAWIGVAGVAVGGLVAVTQTVVNGRLSRLVAATTVEGEHRQRLWEKQSAAYEVTVKRVLARRVRREALTSRGDVGNIGSHPVEELRKAEEPEEIETRATMRAYASEDAWAVYERADEANTAFWLSLESLASAQAVNDLRAGRATADMGGPLPDPDYPGKLAAMNKAKRDAWAADDALFDAINRELSWKPAEKRSVNSSPGRQ